MKKILGIGNALMDILIRIGRDDLLEEFGLPKGSMQLVDRERSDRILQRLGDIPRSMAAGGSAANTIHALGKLGMPSGYIGVTGNDDLGMRYETDLLQAGVTPHIIRSATETGRAVTLISPDSERTFATYLGAAVELAAEHLDIRHGAKGTGRLPLPQPLPRKGGVSQEMSHEHPASSIQHPESSIFSHYDYLHIEGYLVQNHDLIETALKLAKESGLTVSLDMASYNVVEAHREFLGRMIGRYVDILFANEEEAKAFTGREPREALHHLNTFCETVIVKTGSRGSMVRFREITEDIGIIPVVPVDTTGAGDLYAAGFLYGHARGWPLRKCGEAGALLAGRVIEETGAKLGDTRWEEVRQMLMTTYDV